MRKRLYEVKNIKLKDIVTNPAFIVAMLFLLSLLPVLYVGLYNYASGDDYWYGINTYRGWVESGFIGAIKGSLRTVAEFYKSWQGTWFTIFLFTLSPNNFFRDGYVITVFISLGCLIGSISYLAQYYLVKKLNFTKGATTVIVCMISYLAIQYIPKTTSGIYWFNGIMHYTIPFLLGVLAVVYSHKFIENKKKCDYLILFISFTLLGGGSYLAPLAATLAVITILLYQIQLVEINFKNKKFIIKYDWSNLWIIAAFVAEVIGFIISFKSPGNNVRGGEIFGADLKWALQCIYYAIDRGIYLGKDYFTQNIVTSTVYIILAALVWNQVWRIDTQKYKFKFPLLFVIIMNGIYWATYTPEIYSRSDVSGGVPNTYFHIFLIVTFANMVYVHGWIREQLMKRWGCKIESTRELNEIVKRKAMFNCIELQKIIKTSACIMGIVLFVLASMISDIPTTNKYCIECISNGSLKKYSEVREIQDKLLIGTEEKDVCVPEIQAPYPLLHMMMNEEGDGYQNIDRALYYNKNSIRVEMIE